jgi:hypothetical protein
MTRQARIDRRRLDTAAVRRASELLVEAMGWAAEHGDVAHLLRCSRDRALLLLAWRCGGRAASFCGLTVEPCGSAPSTHLSLFLDDERVALPERAGNDCPVSATRQWLSLAGIDEGPVFRHVSRLGETTHDGLSASALRRIWRRTLALAALPNAFDEPPQRRSMERSS